MKGLGEWFIDAWNWEVQGWNWLQKSRYSNDAVTLFSLIVPSFSAMPLSLYLFFKLYIVLVKFSRRQSFSLIESWGTALIDFALLLWPTIGLNTVDKGSKICVIG